MKLQTVLLEAEVVVLREEAVKRLPRKTEAAPEWSKPIAKRDLRAMLGPMSSNTLNIWSKVIFPSRERFDTKGQKVPEVFK